MSSVSIENLKSEFPGKSESQAAAEYAQKWGFVAIVKYKNSANGDYTDIGCCSSENHVNEYLESPSCHEPELIYDGRKKTMLIKNDSILSSKCSLCNNAPDSNSLVLGSGSEFFFCPNCGKFFCPDCYANELPLTDGASGFGMCTTCNNEVQKAVAGSYGKIPYKSQAISNKPKSRDPISDEDLNEIMQDFLNKDR